MNKEISVDESMISYKGRLSFLQYMPKKPHKWGIKAWVLSEAKSGYTWNFQLHTGKDDTRKDDTPLSTHMITELTHELEGKVTMFTWITYTPAQACANNSMPRSSEVVELFD